MEGEGVRRGREREEEKVKEGEEGARTRGGKEREGRDTWIGTYLHKSDNGSLQIYTSCNWSSHHNYYNMSTAP